MRTRVLVILSTLLVALSLMAQTATQTAPAPAGDNAKTCACCNHDKATGKMSCCGKDAACCGKDAACCKGSNCCQGKDGKKCPMMSSRQAGKMPCCASGKCPMAATDGKAKSCCGGKQCERPQAGM